MHNPSKPEFSLDHSSILITGGTGSFGKAFVKTVLEQLQQALYAAGAAVYQQAGADGAGGAPGGNGDGAAGGSASADDVIDAEFTETK